MSDQILVQNDTSLLSIHAKDAVGATLNLTGYTVVLNYNINGGTAVEKGMTITDAALGYAQYRFTAGELSPPGWLNYEVEFTDGSGNTTTGQKKSMPIRREIS